MMAEWRLLVAGSARGEVVVLDEPLSFWGGFDVVSGRISDAHHPQYGTLLTGKVVVMPYSRGSSSTASSLAESIHRGTGPAAILLDEPDEIVVLGAVVPGELYDQWHPVAVIGAALRSQLETGQMMSVSEDGIEFVELAD
ncbi:MAG: DUF126 domain-containing protein [bacterium]|nr:DUF126 domain-containing protein [bacterium]